MVQPAPPGHLAIFTRPLGPRSPREATLEVRVPPEGFQRCSETRRFSTKKNRLRGIREQEGVVNLVFFEPSRNYTRWCATTRPSSTPTITRYRLHVVHCGLRLSHQWPRPPRRRHSPRSFEALTSRRPPPWMTALPVTLARSSFVRDPSLRPRVLRSSTSALPPRSTA